MKKIIPIFLALRKMEGLAPRTLQDYKEHLAAFVSHIPAGTEDYRSAALDYLGSVTNPNTFNLRFAYLKKFFDWCLSEGFLSCSHPLSGLKKRRPVGRIIHIENNTLPFRMRLQ